MSIQISVKHIRSTLRGQIDKAIYKKIDGLLSFRAQKAEFMPSFQNGSWDGRIRLFELKDLSFPTGLLLKVTGLFDKNNVEYNIIDQRHSSNKVYDWRWVSDKNLYPYQREIVVNVIEKKVGIVQAATGAGKTIVMSKFIQELGRKTLVLVHKLDLLEQARNDIMECLGVDVGYIGNQKVDIKDITVGTVQTIVKSLGYRFLKFIDDEVSEKIILKEQDKEKIRHLLRTVNVVVIDECHHVRSETQQNIMGSVPIADYRIGLSATPMRDQEDDLLIEGIFGDVLCKVSATYLIQNGYLIPPTIRFNDIEHTIFDFYEFIKVDSDGNVIYFDADQANKKGRRRAIDIVWPNLVNRAITKVEKIKEKDIIYTYSYGGLRLVRKWGHYEGSTNFVHHIYTKLEEICNIAFGSVIDDSSREMVFKEKDSYKKFIQKMKRKYKPLVMKKKYNFIYDACITDNVYRNEYIVQLIGLYRMLDLSVMVLVRRIRHGENILKILSDETIFLKGEDDIEVRNNTMEKIRKKEIKAIIASTIADEGLNLPALDAVIMAGGGTSKTTALQRVGRALRLFFGKIKAYIEEFYDDAKYLERHSKDREEIYKTEPGFEILKNEKK